MCYDNTKIQIIIVLSIYLGFQILLGLLYFFLQFNQGNVEYRIIHSILVPMPIALFAGFLYIIFVRQICSDDIL